MNKKKQIFIFSYHLIFCLISWFYVIKMIMPSINPFNLSELIRQLNYFTLQTNIMVAIWFTVSIIKFIVKNGFEKEIKYSPIIKGAITTYITITMVVYAIMLAPFINSSSLDFSLMMWFTHYIIPVIFIFDWYFIKTKSKCKLFYAVLWLIYPILYMIYTIIHGYIRDFYPYSFVNPNNNENLILTYIILFFSFLILGIIYTLTHNIKYKKYSK